MFKGRDYVDQLNQILSVLGTPTDETLARLGSERACFYIKSLAKVEAVPLTRIFPQASEGAIKLLNDLLVFDPDLRADVSQALGSEYLNQYHDLDDEPICDTQFDFSFDNEDDIEMMKAGIVREVLDFKNFLTKDVANFI